MVLANSFFGIPKLELVLVLKKEAAEDVIRGWRNGLFAPPKPRYQGILANTSSGIPSFDLVWWHSSSPMSPSLSSSSEAEDGRKSATTLCNGKLDSEMLGGEVCYGRE